MYISEFTIRNFKTFKEATFYFNPDLNVFTGVNNSGKTTVLEAISLWKECFFKMLKKVAKSSKKYNYKANDYIFPEHKYFAIEEIKSVRNPYYNSIFHKFNTKEAIHLEATFTEGNETIKIIFIIKRASGSVYNIIHDRNNFDFAKFNSFFNFNKNIENYSPVNLIYASPVNTLQIKESFLTNPKINEQIKSRESVSVLRNRLYNLNEFATDKFTKLKSDLSYILLGKYLPKEIDFIFRSDKIKHTEINIDIKIQNDRADLFLMGSGTLQIIELLLSVYEEIDYEDLNIILLDEPDSYIHRALQNRLLEVLMKYVGENKKRQIFISTHNESLIRSTKPKFLFHLQGNEMKKYKPIINEDIVGIKKGFQPSPNIKILKSLGSQSGLDILNAIESDKIILVEGKSDAKAIQSILNKNKQDINTIYWSFDGIDEMLMTINSIKYFFRKIKNKTTLWNKSVLIFDKDKHSDEEREKIERAFNKKIGIKTHIWKSYTLESTIFSDIDICSKLINLSLNEDKISIVDVKTEILKNIEEIIKEKKNNILEVEKAINNNDKEIYKHLTGYFEKRKEKLEKLNIKNIIDNSDILLTRYITEYKKKLNPNELHSIMNKDDVYQVFKQTILFFKPEIEIEKDTYFIKLLNFIGYDIWFPEWTRFIDNLMNK